MTFPLADRYAFATPLGAVSIRATSFSHPGTAVSSTTRSFTNGTLLRCSPRRQSARIVSLGAAPAPPPPPSSDDQTSESAPEEVLSDDQAPAPADADADGGIDEVTADDILNSPTFLKKKVELLQKELDTLRNGTDESETQLKEEQSRYVRLAADFDNYRRRSVEDLRKAEGKAVAKVCKEILSVLDNFERAKDSVDATTDNEISIFNSFQSINKQLLDALTKLKVEPIDNCVGTWFDPELHEAISRLDSDEYHEDIICQQFARGYKIEDTLIRAAVVGVSVGPGPADSDPPPQADAQVVQEEAETETTETEAAPENAENKSEKKE